MNTIDKQGFKEFLGQVAFVSKEFSPDILQDVCCQKGVPIINVCLGNNEVYDFSFIIDHTMKFESEKPSNATMAPLCNSLEYFMIVNASVVTNTNRSRIDEGNACTCCIPTHFKIQDHGEQSSLHKAQRIDYTKQFLENLHVNGDTHSQDSNA